MENQAATLTGGCLCGACRYTLSSAPRVHYCHCSMCRKATGSAFAVLAWVAKADMTWEGDRPCTRRSSPIAVRSFCPKCGTPMTLSYGGEIAVHAGSLDQADAAIPKYHYGVEGRLPWVDCGKGLPEHETKERWDS
jgi:hypothetical protein